jgi:hypothetical protein
VVTHELTHAALAKVTSGRRQPVARALASRSRGRVGARVPALQGGGPTGQQAAERSGVAAARGTTADAGGWRRRFGGRLVSTAAAGEGDREDRQRDGEGAALHTADCVSQPRWPFRGTD